MMYSLTHLATSLSLFSLVNTLPTSQPRQDHCGALVETSPWQIKDLVVHSTLPTARVGYTSIHFRIWDTNPGLEFNTSCRVRMPGGTGSRSKDAQSWYQCDYGQVGFQYAPDHIRIERSYVDDCLGDPPYNGGIFFGEADTEFEVTETWNAVTWTQTELEVPITSQT